METESKSALPNHSTEVNMTAAWDNGTNSRRVKSPATKSYFQRIYAWVDNGADDTVKSSYRFIHHMVAADGTPGAANMRALSAGIAALNGSRRGTVLDDAGRRGVYRHLSHHYDDAGRQTPPLLSKEEMKSIFDDIEVKSSEFQIGTQVYVSDEDVYGTVLDIKDNVALIREWKHTDGYWIPTENFTDALIDDVKQDEFIIVEEEKADAGEAAAGSIVSWTTHAGDFYGDIVTVSTDGTLRGEPQGMEIEATPEEPAALVRVWMLDEEEWVPTNVTVVSKVSGLEIIDALPDPATEGEPSSQDMGESDNMQTIKSEVSDMTEQDFEVLVKSIAKLVVAEVGINIESPEEQKDMGEMVGEPVATPANLIEALQVSLSNVVEFYFSAHRAHWNVQGTDFSEYHGLFEEIYSDVYESIDPIAENMRKLGGFPMSLTSMVQYAMIKDDSATTDAKQLASDLAAKNAAIIAMFKAAFEVADSASEQGIANFIAERIDMHEKWQWQLTASLNDTTIQVPKSDSVDEVKSQECGCEGECSCSKDESAEETTTEEVVEEKSTDIVTETTSLTIEDMKEFSDLLKML